MLKFYSVLFHRKLLKFSMHNTTMIKFVCISMVCNYLNICFEDIKDFIEVYIVTAHMAQFFISDSRYLNIGNPSSRCCLIESASSSQVFRLQPESRFWVGMKKL